MRRLAAALAALIALSVPASAQFAPQTKWYWQLSGRVNTSQSAPIYDIDMEGASASLISQLKSAGHTVVCYIDAGTWEPYRSDASQFPDSVRGNKMQDWNEKYLDIRSPIVRTLMGKRMDSAKAKGCDAVEPDNMDSYTAKSGFSLTRKDELDYLHFWAEWVHHRGMKVALKNDAELVNSISPQFDFAIAEQCFDYQECTSYAPFIKQGKAVFVAEYKAFSQNLCKMAANQKLSLAFFNLGLDGKKYQPCP
jgi:hypothetical protein